MKESDLSAMGRSYLYLGRHADADRAFQQAVNASDPSGELIHSYWQHITAMRSQGKIPSRLEARMANQTGHEWPYPVGQMLLGRMSPEELLNAAKNEDKGIERDQLAEANFYLGQKFLLDGDKAKAGDYLDACRELNVTPFLEHHLARIELKEFGERPKGFMNWLKSL
jgi:lipoprotein NlpI